MHQVNTDQGHHLALREFHIPMVHFVIKINKKIILTSMTYPSFFYDIRDHDHNCTVLFPDHPPKIFDCVGHGSFKRPKINGT